MSAGKRLQLAEDWSAGQAGAIIESLLGEFPGMRVTIELPADLDDYLPALVRANEKAFEVESHDKVRTV